MLILVLESKSLLSYLRGVRGKGENSIVDTPLEHPQQTNTIACRYQVHQEVNSRLSVLLSVNKVNFKYFTYLQKLFLGLFPLQM